MSKIDFLKLLNFKLVNYNLLKEMLFFSLPLGLNSLAYWFLTGFNRIVIASQLSVVDNGLYAVATKFSSIIQLLVTCFQMAWQELTFSKAKDSKENMGKFYTTFSNAYIEFLIIGITLCLPIIKIVFPYFINNQYNDAEKIIPLALCATAISSISFFLGSICSTLKMNKYIFSTTAWGAIVNVGIIVLTIQVLGIQSANISLSLGFLIVCIKRVKLLKKLIDIRINIKRIFVFFILYLISIYFYLSYGLLFNILFLIFISCTFLMFYRVLIKKLFLKYVLRR